MQGGHLRATHSLEHLPERNVAVAIIQSQERNMSRGMPSMTALLGLLALAGYQNRDKLADLRHGASGKTPRPEAGNQQGQPLGGLLGNLSGALSGGGVGGLLNGGLSELLERFK